MRHQLSPQNWTGQVFTWSLFTPFDSVSRRFRATQLDDDYPEPVGQDERLVKFLPLPIPKLMVLLACPLGLLNHSLSNVT